MISGSPFMFYIGPEFKCKPQHSDELGLDHYSFISKASGLLGHLGKVRGTRLHCSYICYTTPRCHGFTVTAGNVCNLYNYSPLPEDRVVVENYYQLNCS